MTGYVKRSNCLIKALDQGAAYLLEVCIDRMNTASCRQWCQAEVQSFTSAIWSHYSFNWEKKRVREKRLTQVDHALCYLTETTAKLFARQPRSCRPTDTHAQRRGKKKKKS